MGLMSMLQGARDKIASAIEGEVSKFKNADQVKASLAIVALVAGADGQVEPEERKAGADLVRNGAMFQAFDRVKLASTLEEYYGKTANEILKGDLFDVIQKVKGTDAAPAVVKVGIAIARADGEFEPEEKEVLLEVVSMLGLKAADFKGLG